MRQTVKVVQTQFSLEHRRTLKAEENPDLRRRSVSTEFRNMASSLWSLVVVLSLLRLVEPTDTFRYYDLGPTVPGITVEARVLLPQNRAALDAELARVT